MVQKPFDQNAGFFKLQYFMIELSYEIEFLYINRQP